MSTTFGTARPCETASDTLVVLDHRLACRVPFQDRSGAAASSRRDFET
jgi:hypothetical protein